MKKYLLLVLALLAGSARAENVIGPTNLITCNKVAFVSPATATTTSLIAGVAGTTINICGWHVTSTQSASTTFQLEYGTQGGPCSSPTAFTPAFSVTSTAPSADRQQYAYISTPPGAQVCVISAGSTVGLAVMIWYSTLP